MYTGKEATIQAGVLCVMLYVLFIALKKSDLD